MNIPSFQVFEELVKDIVQSQEGKVKDVQIVIGITDFDKMFESSIQKDVQGNIMKYCLIFLNLYYITLVIFRPEFRQRNSNLC